jgi:hypothetical protein
MPHQRTPKAVTFHLRMTPEAKQTLMDVATQYGEPSDVLREVLLAFVEGRLTIVPPTNKKASLYVPRNQD